MTQIVSQLEKLQQIKTVISNAAGEKAVSGSLKRIAQELQQLDSSKNQKYNIHSNALFGQYNQDGSVNLNISFGDVVFGGVKKCATNSLYGKLAYKKLDSLSFPDLIELSEDYACKYGAFMSNGGYTANFPLLQEISGKHTCYEMFDGADIVAVNWPNLQKISGERACYEMFAECAELESCIFSSITEISGDYSCLSMFTSSAKLKNIGLNNLQKITGRGVCQSMFAICNEIESTNLGNLTEIDGDHACNSMFCAANKIKKTGLSKLKTINGQEACSSMFSYYPSYASTPKETPLSDIDLPSLESIIGTRAAQSMFYKRTNIIEASFPKLQTVSGLHVISNMFAGCPGLTTVSFPMLESIDGQYALSSLCYGNIALETINLNSLRSINGDYALCTFLKGCEKISRIDFPNLQEILSNKAFSGTSNNEIYYPFYGCTNLTEIHFRYDIKQLVEGLEGYDKKFGAANATIYFDLACAELEITPTPADATVTFYDENGTEIPNPTVTEVNKYAWSTEEATYYTDNENATQGDVVYDTNGNKTQYSVESCKNGKILLKRPVFIYNVDVTPSDATVTFTQNSEELDKLSTGEVIEYYAWTTNGITYYTKTDTPVVGEAVYDSNKELVPNKTIIAVDENTGTITIG